MKGDTSTAITLQALTWRFTGTPRDFIGKSARRSVKDPTCTGLHPNESCCLQRRKKFWSGVNLLVLSTASSICGGGAEKMWRTNAVMNCFPISLKLPIRRRPDDLVVGDGFVFVSCDRVVPAAPRPLPEESSRGRPSTKCNTFCCDFVASAKSAPASNKSWKMSSSLQMTAHIRGVRPRRSGESMSTGQIPSLRWPTYLHTKPFLIKASTVHFMSHVKAQQPQLRTKTFTYKLCLVPFIISVSNCFTTSRCPCFTAKRRGESPNQERIPGPSQTIANKQQVYTTFTTEL